ncbi:MAG TPA: hypothetical protein DIW23_05665, partial [Anaerolineae bacterium]|nr:hypothetical protein [Anaerolineae bacterium]
AKKHKSDKFSTYATWGIRQAIKRYASRHKSGFSRSAELDEASYRVLRIQKELTDKLSRTPTYEEVAQTCNLRVSKVKAILSTPKMIRIEEGDNRNPYEDSIDNSKIEKIPDDSKSVSETVEIHEYHKYLEGLKKTHPRHAKIIKLHYGLDETGQSYSLAEIARKMKLTRERVRQIHDAAIAIMREYDEN